MSKKLVNAALTLSILFLALFVAGVAFELITPTDRPASCKSCAQRGNCNPSNCKAQGVYQK
jgi:hypothetical protein